MIYSKDELLAYIKILADKFLNKELHEWFINFTEDIILSDVYFKRLNNNILGEEQNIFNLYKKKIVHSIVAIEYLFLVSKNSKNIINRKDIIEAFEKVYIFELVQVDIADTLAEIEDLRSFSNQLKLFESLKTLFLEKKYTPMFTSEVLNRNPKLLIWVEYITFLARRFTFDANIYETNIKFIDRRLTEYYMSILLDHVRTLQEKERARVWYRENTFRDYKDWKNIPKFLKENGLWEAFFGDSISFLSIVFLSELLAKDMDDRFIINIIKLFRTIGAINVIIDDLLDVAEDQSRFDSTLALQEPLKNLKKLIDIFFEDYNSIINQYSPQESKYNYIKNLSSIIHIIFEVYYKIGKIQGTEDIYINNILESINYVNKKQYK